MPLSHRSTSPGIFRLVPMHPAESVRPAEPMHAAESPRTTEITHTTTGERAAMNARADECNVAVTHLMKVIEVVKVMEMVDEDQAHARANE